ncbi:SAP domain-containing protein [Aquisalibacillus elongatus]|uniref:SAP domain-containing protein n=1 Tax=Aquisalibacillus elongatus TaxID=485577 RepID=A0A3N5B7I9_9BACI|nr:SAP domain-containing protein [Aquisalibacillus elongatus]RPF53404.1 SAP domain-containing protein [Aquisalibacillus elongatus]
MYLQDILPKMSKLYLNRTVDSFLKDVRMDTEEEMREVIIKNVDEFQNKERVKRNLNFNSSERDIALLNEMVLMSLMDQQGYILSESEVFSTVENLEKEIVEQSKDEEYIKTAIPEERMRIYKAVLIESWKKDDSLNEHEINILNVLRKELELSKRDHYLIESIIGRFPQKNNKLHTHKQIERTLRDLQSRGIILRYRDGKSYYIIPNEIARTVRYEMGGELRNEVYETLLNDLNVTQLKVILNFLSINVGGNKKDLIQRILKHNILPSTALKTFNTKELTQILKNLDGAKISGTKEDKVQNIIDYYENLSTPEFSDPTDERSRMYDFYEQLASRDYKSLRVNKVIEKDINVERYFEEATHYLIQKKLGIEPIDMKGSKHADGKIKYNPKEVVLWDNKSTEKPYEFPSEHFDQFLGYIRTEKSRVTLFLIIVSEYTRDAISQAQKLKAFSEEDSDVAIIKATDLKYVAENWKSYSNNKNPKFNLQVFNLTGELTRNILNSRMEWAL